MLAKGWGGKIQRVHGRHGGWNECTKITSQEIVSLSHITHVGNSSCSLNDGVGS